MFIVCFLLESDEDKHASEWSRDGKYLLYACQGKDTRWDLWALPRFATIPARAHYRPTPDGRRFLVLAPLRQETIPPTTVVLNWTAGIR